jgi:starch synthase
MTENVSVAVLGSGEPRFEDMFRHFVGVSPDHFALVIGYNDALAHRIEAGSDMFLMPSRYEPCGLNQMYSLRYGAVPIVRATGGLEDTVDETTGFKFGPPTPAALAEAIKAALDTYGFRAQWEGLMKAGMAKDHSWTASARAYQRLYRQLG